MSLLVVATITSVSGSETDVAESIRSLVDPSRAEPGCLDYQAFRSQLHPAVFVTVERWRDGAAFDAHMRSPHMAAVSTAFAGRVAVDPVQTYSVAPLTRGVPR